MDRIKITDPNAATHISNHIILGKSFAFLGKEVFSSPSYSWLRKLFGGGTQNKPSVISLLGRDSVQLPGIEIEQTRLDHVELRSITCDKSIYRVDRDFVNLLVLNALRPNSSQTIEIQSMGSTYSRHQVQTGAYGECQLTLKDLPVGEYDALFAGEQKATCNFSVAEYRLVPLVAAMIDRTVGKDGALKVTLNLETYGTPVNGDVRVEVLDRGTRQQSITTTAQEGRCTFSFHLTGEGPHSLSLQLVSDASRTATVPITGSRETERSFTVFSPLGNEVVGSLLPAENTREVRGIYLEEGGTRTTPVSLDRVDASKARLNIHAKLEALRVVLIDPSYAGAEKHGIDPDTAPHPSLSDDRYKRAEELFQQGDHRQSLQLFKASYAELSGSKHPYYSYFIACCLTALNEREEAIDWLRQSITEGWSDFAHLASDPDLEALQGLEPFEKLLSRGITEVTFDNATPGQTLELDVYSPVTLIAIGTFANGKPWEGWASVVTPSSAPPQVVAPTRSEPGAEVTIEISTTQPNSSIYAIVKDARLLSPDTPVTRLAACIKSHVEKANKTLAVAYPTEVINVETRNIQYSMRSGSMPAGAGRGSSNTMEHRVPQPPPAPGLGGAFGSLSRSAGVSDGWGGSAAEPEAARGQPIAMSYDAAPPPQAPMMMRQMMSAPAAPAAAPTAAATAPPPQRAAKAIVQEPEVVFAGFVPVTNGQALLKVTLPDVFTDYIVECFQTSGLDWSAAEARFRAEKDPFIDFILPAFAREGEATFGTIQVGSRDQTIRASVLHDGQPVVLTADQEGLSADAVSGTAAFRFPAGPGTYEAIIEDAEGKMLAHRHKEVQQPGKLKRRVKALRLLKQDDSAALANNPRLLSLSVLPGLDTSFKLLMQATADYGHACCEQTGAKILSNCLIYLTAPDDQSRLKAEAAVIAGIRREETMWLRGRGFKMYPESPNSPHDYYTPLVARYLFLISALVNGKSPDMRKAMQDANAMAVDASRACTMDWPARNIASCQDAYSAIRFSDNGVTKEALDYVRKQTANGVVDFCKKLPNNPYLGTQVFNRTELAYAAACLLRSGDGSSLSRAIELAGPVIESFNESGGLYSTVDSVAAMVLMSELEAAKITAGGGKVEIDGVACTLAEALAKAGTISSVKVLEGVVTVEECSQVIEDWSTLSGDLQIRVALEKAGRPQRSFSPGDAIELVVSLESGYTDGDLLWVCLPDALSRVVGGGQVKLFSVDFRGQKDLRIPLAATGCTRSPSGQGGTQTFAVCVRNMFNEERGASAGLQQVSIN